MSHRARSPPSSGSYDYVSVAHPSGASGLRTPPARSSEAGRSSRGSPYDYISQNTTPHDNRRETRASVYSQRSPPRRETVNEPMLQSGNGHPYPLRQQAVSPAPSYGAISRDSGRPGWSESQHTLNEWMEGRPRSMAAASDPAASSIMLDKMGLHDEAQSTTLLYKEGYSSPTSPRSRRQKRGFWTRGKVIGLICLLLLAAGIAIGIGVWQATKNKSSGTASNGNNAQNGAVVTSGSPTTAAAPSASATPVQTVQYYGGAGPVTMMNGTVFNYNNTLGGTWCAIPYNDSARPQGDSPALNEQWNYDTDLMRGVNLGGWLVTEPFIAPELYYPYMNATTPAVDEWTLMQNLGANGASVMENHYATFITEIDIAQIASAGLNWVRLPVPYWMIETYPGEEFLEGVSFKYFQLALDWCRKYGLRVELDLHTAPGSQNGLNHSGRLGSINFLNGIMGIANAQRTLNYVRTLAQFISQPQYKNVVPLFMVLNEPYITTMGTPELRTWYYESYKELRSIGGVGTGNGPMMIIHDGFIGQSEWVGFLTGADRLALESHFYFAFSPPYNSLQYTVTLPCQDWAAGFNQSMDQFGFSTGGEWALAPNDCGLWVRGVNQSPQYTGDCTPFVDYTSWTAATKQLYHDLALASMDTFRNYAFWTWKIGINPMTGLRANPMWDYSLGLQEGYMPQDARIAVGACPSLSNKYNAGAVPTYAFTGLAPSATGGAGNNVAAAQIAAYGVWPVTSITGYANVANFPTYTATQAPITLSPTALPSTLFPAGAVSTAAGNGWFNAADSASYATPVSGCTYPGAWNAVNAAVPNAPCTGGVGPATATGGVLKMRRAPAAEATPAPQ